VARRLKCETETRTMEIRVQQAFIAAFQPGRDSEFPKGFRAGGCSTYFEHGQWWVLAWDRDDQQQTFSVVDASGGDSVDGFDFERV
jgi:hypothetical protein